MLVMMIKHSVSLCCVLWWCVCTCGWLLALSLQSTGCIRLSPTRRCVSGRRRLVHGNPVNWLPSTFSLRRLL